MTQPTPKRTRLAFAFSADLTLDQLKARLAEISPWKWCDGDSHYYGDYLGTKAVPHDAVVRIYEESLPSKGRYSLNIRYDSIRRIEWVKHDLEELKSKLLARVLPALGARDIMPTEPVD